MPWKEELPSGKYRAVWRDDLGNRRSKGGFTQERAALAYAGEQESKARRGEATTAGRSQRWGDWCDEWLQLRQVENTTETSDLGRIDNHLRPKWGKAAIARIDHEHVQIWVNEMIRGGMTPATVTRIFYVFSASMKAAMLGRRIPANPCSHVRLPTSTGGSERYFTREEIEAATAKIWDRVHRDAVIVDVGTGLRFAELAGLHWNRVNFAQRIITVAEVYEPGLNIIRAYPKSKRERHIDAVPSWVWAVLEARRDEFSTGQGCGMPHGASRRPCRSGLVFTRRDSSGTGVPLDDLNMLRRHWKPAQARAGISPVGTLKDLRHTYASWLVQDAIPLQEVQRLLGHASIVTTQRYAHLGTTQNAAVLRALEGQGGKLLSIVPRKVAPSLPHEAASGRSLNAI